MDIAVGDTILTRKQHPCGAASFEAVSYTHLDVYKRQLVHNAVNNTPSI